MTREELTQHWCCIIETVLTAESRIIDHWAITLKAAKRQRPEEVEAVRDGYTRAIAEEILSATPEEDLKKWYDL